MTTTSSLVNLYIGKLLEQSVLSELAASRLIAALETTTHPFDAVMTELGLMREDALSRSLACHFDVAFFERPTTFCNAEQIERFGPDFLRINAILPIKLEDGTSSLAVANPFDSSGREMIEYASGETLGIVIATRSAIMSALAAAESASVKDGDSQTSFQGLANDSDLERLREFARQEPVIRFVSRIIQLASDARATDIHIEPLEYEVRVRIRVDGALKVIETVPSHFLPGIVTRIKILSALDISERRMPQDGRMRVSVRGQDIDIRVSISPVIYGEALVLRILNRSTVTLDLNALGFEDHAQDTLRNLSRLPNGIVLVTGPTGSGKTTTLYALIALLNDAETKIFTVEDPVEYRMDGITQLQINALTGLTFSRALRSILRQDPDIILIGEIRDRETAEIAMQAALTGHLVLSTLHTNSAAGAITRLRDMGVEDYLIGATLKGIAAQRLLKKRCECEIDASNVRCAKCNGTGMSGRTAAYEIAVIDDQIARSISDGLGETAVLEGLKSKGFVPLADHAHLLVAAGVTSQQEALRVGLPQGGAHI